MDNKTNDLKIKTETIAESSKTYFNLVKDQVICILCNTLLNEPLMCEFCEKSCCQSCIKNYKKTKKNCPYICEQGSSKAQFIEVNRTQKRILENIKIKCEYGCEVPILNYSVHLEQCRLNNSKVLCFNCNEDCLYSDLKYKTEDEVNDLKEKITSLKKEIEKQKKIKIK